MGGSETIDLSTSSSSSSSPGNQGTGSVAGGSSSAPGMVPASPDGNDVPLAGASPITQVATRDNDAHVTGAQIALHHHQHHEGDHHHHQNTQKKGFWQSLFSCCVPQRNRVSGAHSIHPSKYSGPVSKSKPLLPPFRPTEVLLKPLAPEDQGKKCLVLDLDETLLHSSFKPVPNPDFIIPVEIEGQMHNVYVLKRPGVDEFLRIMGERFEIVVFTASLAKYADPVLDKLDIHKVVKYRLFRESCYYHKGNYVKDLSRLGRDPKAIIFIDNSPSSYMFQPENALPCSTWFDDPNDRELTEMTDFLIELSTCDDVMELLQRAEKE